LSDDEREHKVSVINAAKSKAMLSASEPQVPFKYLPQLPPSINAPLAFGDLLDSWHSKEERFQGTERVPMDVYFKGSMYANAEKPSQLWVIGSVRITKDFIEQISGYARVFCSNPTMSIKLRELDVPAWALEFPYVKEIFDFQFENKPEGDTILLVGHDDYIIGELQRLGVKYHCECGCKMKAESMEFYKDMSLVILPEKEYFDHITYYTYIGIGVPMVSMAPKGRGFLGPQQGVFHATRGNVIEVIQQIQRMPKETKALYVRGMMIHPKKEYNFSILKFLNTFDEFERLLDE
jgi:hypothetical protein